MHRSIKPHSHHLCYAARIVAVCLVDLRLQHRPHMSRLNTNHWQARFGENAVKPLRQRSSFQPNALEAIDGVRQNLQESFRLTRHFASRTILPASSTMQTLVSLTDTSSPAK